MCGSSFYPFGFCPLSSGYVKRVNEYQHDMHTYKRWVNFVIIARSKIPNPIKTSPNRRKNNQGILLNIVVTSDVWNSFFEVLSKVSKYSGFITLIFVEATNRFRSIWVKLGYNLYQFLRCCWAYYAFFLLQIASTNMLIFSTTTTFVDPSWA